jgi:hypothetical protein
LLLNKTMFKFVKTYIWLMIVIWMIVIWMIVIWMIVIWITV